MLATSIPSSEEYFKNQKKDANNNSYTLNYVKYGDVDVCELTPANASGFYEEEECTKTGIVLHFTVGHLRGDLATLCKDNYKVCVPFVIARDGTIYKLFDPKYWASHLGAGAVGGNTVCSKKTIAIELSNYGPLQLSGSQLNSAYGDKYCDVSQTEFYQVLDEEFRGYKYFATFTTAQYDALQKLLSQLCTNFSIPFTFLDDNVRYSTFSNANEAINFSGICSHVNYRASGKWDIGEAFDWEAIRSDSTSNVQEPSGLGNTGIDITKDNITKYYNHTEKDTKGGYFPVGINKIWHGGLHIFTNEGSDVFACIDGKIVAARLSETVTEETDPVGHRNFILMQHTVNEKRCFSLYMHLKNNPLNESDELVKNAQWLKKNGKQYKVKCKTLNCRSTPSAIDDSNLVDPALIENAIITFVAEAVPPSAWKKVKRSDGVECFVKCSTDNVTEINAPGIDADLLKALKTGAVVKVDKEVKAGDLLWKSGKYGLPENQTGQIHWEIFSEENLVADKVATDVSTANPPQPVGETRGFTASTDPQSTSLRIKSIKGPSTAKIGEKITCYVEKVNYSDAPAAEFDKIKWKVKIDTISENPDGTGSKFTYTIPDSARGKEISIYVYAKSIDEKICIRVKPSDSWIAVEDTDENFNADGEKIKSLFGDLLADNKLTESELVGFYKDNPGGKAVSLRSIACKFVSEWGVPDLAAAIDAIKTAGDFDHIEESDYKPYLWWKEAKDAGVELPASPHVWHYNPVKFMETFGQVPVAKPAAAPAPAAPSGTNQSVGVKRCTGPSTVDVLGKVIYKVSEFTGTPTDLQKKSVSWIVYIDGAERRKFEKCGEILEFDIPDTWAGDEISVHPYMNSPLADLKVISKVGPYFEFDGKNLTAYNEKAEKIISWPACSGENGIVDQTKEHGPIPEGKYLVEKSNIQNLPGILDRIGSNEWDGGESDWGKQRIQIFSYGAKTHGRMRFYIHGGKKAGTGFGIDLTNKIDDFVSWLKAWNRDKVVLVVRNNTMTASQTVSTTDSSLLTSSNGLKLIMDSEGFKSMPYNDDAGHATIGYGTLLHTGSFTAADTAKYPNGVTKDEALLLLKNSVKQIEPKLASAVKVKLNQNQWDALISWTYNLGTTKLKENDCTWLRDLNSGNYDKVPDGLMMWNKATVKGKVVVLDGLTDRRKKEGILFKTSSSVIVHNGAGNITASTVTNSNAISDSVGLNGKNKSEDVISVKQKLKELGYPIVDMSGNSNPELIKSIKFFQISFTNVSASVSNFTAVSLPDGLISKGGLTANTLFGSNPKRYSPPAKGTSKPIADDINQKITSATGNVKTLWDGIVSKWNQISPYLPSDSKLTSGYRSPSDQRAILHNWYNSKYKDEIIKKYGQTEWQKYKDMQGVNDASADPVMCKMIKETNRQLIAVPGTSKHEKGKAIDIGGQGDIDQAKALLWCHVNFGDAGVSKILPERNGCMHFEFS